SVVAPYRDHRLSPVPSDAGIGEAGTKGKGWRSVASRDTESATSTRQPLSGFQQAREKSLSSSERLASTTRTRVVINAPASASAKIPSPTFGLSAPIGVSR